MSDGHLLILISRMVGKDEWNSVWGFSTDDLIAFIRQGEVTTLKFQEFKKVDLSTQIDADVWVINGKQYADPMRRKAIFAALDKIAWQDQKVILRIHRGGAGFVESEDFQTEIEKIEFPNTKGLLKRAENYGIGDTVSPNHPVVRFASVINGKEKGDYKECLKTLKDRAPLHLRMSDIKHHLSYVLHPLDINLQGLVETNFQLDYWRDVVKDYQNGKAVKKLEEVKNLLYKTAGVNSQTVEQIIADANNRYSGGAWEAPWTELKEKYFPQAGDPEHIKKILKLLEGNTEVHLETIKGYFSNGENPIHTWITDLNKSLAEIRDALSERESRSVVGKS